MVLNAELFIDVKPYINQRKNLQN